MAVNMGATILTTISDESWGTFLQIMEHHADVFIVGRRKQPGTDISFVALRSDIWPSSWEGKPAQCKLYESDPEAMDVQLYNEVREGAA